MTAEQTVGVKAGPGQSSWIQKRFNSFPLSILPSIEQPFLCLRPVAGPPTVPDLPLVVLFLEGLLLVKEVLDIAGYPGLVVSKASLIPHQQRFR